MLDDFSEFYYYCIFGTLHFEKSSNTAKKIFGENEEKPSNYSITEMAAFGTKNVHSALYNYYIIFKTILTLSFLILNLDENCLAPDGFKSP